MLLISVALLFLGYGKYVGLQKDFKLAQTSWETKEAQYQQALVLERQQYKIIIKREVQIKKDLDKLNEDKSDEEVIWEKNPLPESVINDFDWLYEKYPTAVYGTRGSVTSM